MSSSGIPASYVKMTGLKARLLRWFFRKFPFNLKGDLLVNKQLPLKPIISCLICAHDRPEALNNLLDDLARQNLDRSQLEVIILNDGGQERIASVVRQYSSRLPIQYKENPVARKIIGQIRNQTLEMSCGKYILFLDDDTRILQDDFLKRALGVFSEMNPDVIIPRGEALYGIVKLKYDYFDRYSFGCAGCLYKREILDNLGGFKNDLASYEDIELGIRMTILGGELLKSEELSYYHPPFYFESMRKPISIGQSVLKLRRHYSFPVWIIVFLNALRFLPCGLIPDLRYQQWFKISWGVLLSCFKRDEFYY